MSASGKNYSFKLLYEEPSDVDAFAGETHNNIAETLYSLILNEEKAITIGLEGPWGSGKSTVIRILKKKLEREKGIFFTQFDAWAHEGDPLRRILLENLIKDISDTHETLRAPLSALLNKISGKEKKILTANEQGVTLLGKIFAMALLLVPIGTVLLGKVEYDKLLSGFDSELSSFLFLSGTTFVLAPFWVLLGNWLRIGVTRKFSKISVGLMKSERDWLFLQNESIQTITQSIIEGPDRSSIEFESYFSQVVTHVLDADARAKIVLIFDNLDRIAKEDALKIWSTLQTFVQHRGNQNGKSWFDRVWIIIPYDLTPLSQLWSMRKKKDAISKSFLDKSFQIRLDVPKPIFKTWEKFAERQVSLAVGNWSDEDRQAIIRVLKDTRSDLNDIPTPREIKNFINQVAIMTAQRRGDISVDAIAYYVYWREMLNSDVAAIRRSLLDMQLAYGNHWNYFKPEKLILKLAALSFGVPLDEAARFLLSNPILDALQNGDEVTLAELAKKHGSSFWIAFSTLQFDPILSFARTAAKAIYLSLWQENSDQCSFFVSKIKGLPESRNFEEFENSIQNYVYWIHIASNPSEIYDFLINQLNDKLGKNGVNWQSRGDELSAIIDAVANRMAGVPLKKLDNLNLVAVINLVSGFRESQKFAKFLCPNAKILKELIGDIAGNVNGMAHLHLVIRYLHGTGEFSEWRAAFDECVKTAILPQLNEWGNEYKVLLELLDIVPEYLHELSTLFENVYFYGRFHHTISPDAAYLWGLAPPDQFHNYSNPEEQIDTGMAKMRLFWETPSDQKAEEILTRYKKYQHWKNFWHLGKRRELGLMESIFKKMAGDSELAPLYKNATVEDVFKGFFITRREELELIINDFRAFGNLDEKLMQFENLKISYLVPILKLMLEMGIKDDLRARITAAQ
ncbi:MAG: hypothetical protein KF713_11270 [Turneriella sp.]|nr:hypothetical protein [Turneriella sp.]